MRSKIVQGLIGLIAAGATQHASSQTDKPNIIIIYADDLGYGDVSCYGATKIKTPNIDYAAKQGLRFTNAHCTSATSTPSRYSLLTGEYAWRKKGTGIATGDAPAIIHPETFTLPDVLKGSNYKTGVVGKWHLGLGTQSGADWNGEIQWGPADLGFDYNFIIPATGDRVPCVYVENRRVVNLDPKDPINVSFNEPILVEPTGKEHPEMLKIHPSHGHDMTIINGISRIGYMSGGKSALWNDETIADVITEKAVNFIKKNKENRFFLYFSTHDIHVPRVPNPRFAGKSGMGPRGDVILQFDWSVGEILKTLEKLNLSDKTLLIITSDNGPVVDDGYKDQAVELLGDHRPAGPLRGGKYSAFDGGTRVVFIALWPGKIKPGSSNALFSQIDLMATFSRLTGVRIPENAGPDSFDNLEALMGQDMKGRKWIVEQSGSGKLSVVQGDWKYIEPGPGPKLQVNTNTETGNDADPQLYDLKNDLGEQNNLASQYPAVLNELKDLLASIRERR